MTNLSQKGVEGAEEEESYSQKCRTARLYTLSVEAAKIPNVFAFDFGFESGFDFDFDLNFHADDAEGNGIDNPHIGPSYIPARLDFVLGYVKTGRQRVCELWFESRRVRLRSCIGNA